MQAVEQSVTGYIKFQIIQIGIQNGIFEGLKEKSSVKNLAKNIKCDERYLKEWCQAMTLGGILDCEDDLFQVKPDAYDFITTQKENIDLTASVGEQLPKVSAAFKTGHGVTYNSYRNVASLIEALMADFYENKIGSVLKTNPLFSDISSKLATGGKIMDFGCGCGKSSISLAKAYPNAQVIGYDIDETSIERAEKNKVGTPNVEFFCQNVFEFDAKNLAQTEKFDLVTFLLCLHDLSYPTKALAIAKSILKPGGKVIVLEMAASDQFCPAAKDEFGSVAISVMHCLPCSRPEDGSPGEDIGNPFRLNQLIQTAKNAGFKKVHKINDGDLNADLMCRESGISLFKIE